MKYEWPFAPSCDKGYFGPFCVPSTQLLMGMRDTMDGPSLSRERWPELYGGEVTNICGMIVSGPSLTFYKVGGSTTGFRL